MIQYKFHFFWLVIIFITFSCSDTPPSSKKESPINEISKNPYIKVLGIAQDAGFPQANCKKECCKNVWEDKGLRKMVSCLAVVDPSSNESWIFDATPDFKDQLKQLTAQNINLSGIFLTHAHIGHYTGLIHLGREVMGANEVPVFAMPKMKFFLENNGPWSQLVTLKNIDIQALKNDSTVFVNKNISVTPLLVPHRDEFSETVGYKIKGKSKSALFIPDIDKWQLWDKDILEEIKMVDYAFLDGSFFENGEIPGRDMSEIPHPFIQESIALFSQLSKEDKAKIHFIHFNHTNPILKEESKAQREVKGEGMNIAKELAIFEL